MADRPIIFTGDSVRAILAGRKTQSRRVIKAHGLTFTGDEEPAWWDVLRCPYGAPGSRLWVREAFSPLAQTGCRSCIADATYVVLRDGTQVYRSGERFNGLKEYTPGAFDHVVWRSPIHMPRWASRLTLEILSVRVERVQDISEEDARAEGTRSDADEIAAAAGLAHLRGSDAARALPTRLRSARDNFRDAWDAINGRRAGCSWRDNPWCWALEFRRVEAT